ncbi:MAG: right-handed parallel beta-helix repeat-containing protein [Bacteroidota bacterium]
MMKPITISILIFLLIGTAAFAQPKVVKVRTSQEFIKAIASDTHIMMEPGLYNLSKVQGTNTDFISWGDTYDGDEPTIQEVKNLTITGKLGTEILIQPAYAWVLKFIGGSNIKLENIVFGHTEPGYCTGGVLSFTGARDIEVRNCVLFGSGTEGIALENVGNFRFTQSVIKECTYDLLTISESFDVVFEQATFMNTGEYDLVQISNSNNIKFNACTFRENFNGEYLPHFFTVDPNSGKVTLQYCTFFDNQVEKFANFPNRLTLVDNIFEGNTFGNPQNK